MKTLKFARTIGIVCISSFGFFAMSLLMLGGILKLGFVNFSLSTVFSFLGLSFLSFIITLWLDVRVRFYKAEEEMRIHAKHQDGYLSEILDATVELKEDAELFLFRMSFVPGVYYYCLIEDNGEKLLGPVSSLEEVAKFLFKHIDNYEGAPASSVSFNTPFQNKFVFSEEGKDGLKSHLCLPLTDQEKEEFFEHFLKLHNM